MRVTLVLFAACFFLFSCKKENGNPETNNPAPPANARFELLQPEQTGVRFSNEIKEDFQNNILGNSYLYNGGGVAVLDVNNDGLPDLYFSATQESNRLFLNKGNLQFEDITEKSGTSASGGIKTGVTVVDINADGFQDLYVCRSGMQPTPERANLLYLNNKGDGTFSERAAEYGLDDRSASNHANFFDYDLDGDLDCYVLNHPVNFKEVNKARVMQDGAGYLRKTEPTDEWESDKLFRNDTSPGGGVKFTNVSQQAGINNRAWGLSVTVSDFNGDRYPDIYVGNDYIEPDLLYINNKNGTFSIQTNQYFRHLSNHTMGVDIADFNNDNLIDLVALDMVAEDNQRQKALMTTMLLDRYNNLVRFGYGHQIMRNVLQANNGNGTFSDIGVMAGVWNTDWSWSPLLADLDNDGWKDLYVTNGYRRDISNLDYLNYTVDSIMRTGGLSSARFKTIDEYLKLIPTTPLQNYLFKNTGGMSFQNVSSEWGLPEKGYSNGSAYADLDKDGDLELIVNNIVGNPFIYKNKTVNTPLEGGQSQSRIIGRGWLQIKLKGSPKNPDATGARVRIAAGGTQQYLELTPTRGFFSSSEHLLHFGLGDVKTISELVVQYPDGKVQFLTEVPANQRLTLSWSDAKQGDFFPMVKKAPLLFAAAKNMGLDFRHVEDDFIDFNRERLLPHKFSNLGPNLATGDVNGDGREDFFIGGAGNQPGAIFLQNANSTFTKSRQPAFETDAVYEDLGCAFFDADRDNDLDLYVASGGNSAGANSPVYQDRLYLNDGKGNFTKAADRLPAETASGSCVSIHDFDKDGDPDVFVGGLVTPGMYPTPPQTLILKNDNGKFTEVCQQIAPELAKIGMVNDLLWADLDGDQTEELIVAGEWLPMRFFQNDKGTLLPHPSSLILNSKGWWNCVQAADLDKDGDLDLIGGNLGWNSRLFQRNPSGKATENQPLRLYAKDFDANGSIEPVLAYYNGGKLFPLPLRDPMVKQMPSLKKKFLYHDAYGKATLEEVFPKKDLESAMQFEAQTFTTCWFENQGGGKFAAHDLPAETQMSPCNQVLVQDFNGDGNPDLLLVGNSSSPDVETGRYDAGNGCLLTNDGKGNFTFVRNLDSGFWATKEARDLAAVKLANGSILFLVANNNDVLEGFVR